MTTDTVKYSSEKLAEFKQILSEKLEDVQGQIEDKKASVKNRKEQVAQSNLGFSEGSRHFQQQAKNKQLIRRLQHKARELKAALGRIEDETYGVCDRTGKLIREARLQAMPTARFDIVRKV